MSIRINVSDKAAASESRDLDPVPTGKYLVQVDDAKLMEVKDPESKNLGESYMNLALVILEDHADGTYEGKKIFTNIMLFGETYSAVWLMKALGQNVSSGEVDFPEPGDLIGEQFVVKAVKVGETISKKDSSKVYPPKNEVKGYFPASDWKAATPRRATAGAAKVSKLP